MDKLMQAIKGYKVAMGGIVVAIAIWSLHIYGSAIGITPDYLAKMPSMEAATNVFWSSLALVGIRSVVTPETVKMANTVAQAINRSS